MDHQRPHSANRISMICIFFLEHLLKSDIFLVFHISYFLVLSFSKVEKKSTVTHAMFDFF